MKNRLGIAAVIGGLLLAAACNKSPFDRTKDSSSGTTGTLGGSGQLTIFNNELASGGGAFEYPGGDNVGLSFDDLSNPIGKRSIRFSWNGQPADGVQLSTTTVPPLRAIFAGFSLMHVPLFADYTTTPGRDLRAAGYTKVTFYARANLSTNTCLKVEAGGPTSACMVLTPNDTVNDCKVDGTPTDPCNGLGIIRAIGGNWASYTLPITNTEQSAVKDLFKATLIYGASSGSTGDGQGGTVYFDQIFYKAS